MTNPLNPLSDKTIVLTGDVEFRNLKAEHFAEMFDTLLIAAKEEHEEKTSNPSLTYSDLFEGKCSHGSHLSFVYQCMTSLQSVDETPELREVYDKYQPLLSEFYYQCYTADTRYFESIEAYMETEEYKQLNELKKKVVDETYNQYIKSGIKLPEKDKAKLKKLGDELDLLTTKFGRNVLDNEAEINYHFNTKSKQLKGLYPDMIATAKSLAERDGLPGYSFTIGDGNLYDLYLSEDEATRKDVYHQCRKIASTGKFDNRPITARIAKIRQKRAKILGYDSYSHLTLEDKMAKDPETVGNFLQNLGDQAIGTAKQERKDFLAFGEKLLKHKPEFWDSSLIARKYKEKLFKINQNEVKEYLRLDTVIDGLFGIIKEFFNVEFKDAIKEKTAKSSNKLSDDSIIYNVYENVGEGKNLKQKFIGSLQLDMFKHKTKRGGAWMSPFMTYHKFEDGFEKLPTAHVICNFTKCASGDVQTISMLDVETIFHEFGHAVHHLLSKVEKSDFSSMAVEWDAVELPSQFMENFVWDFNYLEKMTSHKETGKSMPREMFDKLLKSKNFMAGCGMVRQVLMSEMDLKIYNQKPGLFFKSPVQIEAETRKKWKIAKYDKKSYIITDFNHIWAGGYSSKYYSYAWAEVLSSDAYEIVTKNPDLIQTYKKEILEAGAKRPMADSYRTFAGRDPDVGALIRSRGL